MIFATPVMDWRGPFAVNTGVLPRPPNRSSSINAIEARSSRKGTPDACAIAGRAACGSRRARWTRLDHPCGGTVGAGDRHRAGGRFIRCGGSRCDRHRNQPGHQHRVYRHHQRCRQLRHHERADRRIRHRGWADGLQRRAVQGDAVGCADRARRLQDGSRQHRGTGRRLRRWRGAADGKRGCRDQGGT